MKHMNERIVALDIGDVRIGVAVSDPSRTIASPVEVITRIGWGPDVRRISGGNLDQRTAVCTDDEIGSLANSFNHMTDSLQQYIADLKEVTAK